MIFRGIIRLCSTSGRRGWSRARARRRSEGLFRISDGLVTTPAAESLQVDCDVGVAKLFEVLDQIAAERLPKKTSKIAGIHFNSRQIRMMADAEIGKSMVAQKIFGFFDLC